MPQISLELIQLVNMLKEHFDCSTSSLDRTPLHNKAVGGAPDSRHVHGDAIDLVFDPGTDLVAVGVFARTIGFQGVEVDLTTGHLHLDLRPSPWYVVVTSTGKVFLDDYLTQHKHSATV